MTASRRTLVWTVSLALVVVIAAGVTGTAHFGGARWLPNLKTTGHRPVPRTAVPGPTAPHRVLKPRSGGSPVIGQILILAVIAIVVVGVAVMLWYWWVGRQSRAALGQNAVAVTTTSTVPSEPEPEPDAPALRTGIDLALHVLDEQRDPADAIVRAWLGLQETAEESGLARRPSETPTEFTSRIMSRALTDDRAIKTLLRLYLRTRFGDHPVTEDDVSTVREALQELLRTWPAHPSGAGAGRR